MQLINIDYSKGSGVRRTKQIKDVRFSFDGEDYSVTPQQDGTLQLHKHCMKDSGPLVINPSSGNQIYFK